jgi:hypothetical protein
MEINKIPQVTIEKIIEFFSYISCFYKAGLLKHKLSLTSTEPKSLKVNGKYEGAVSLLGVTEGKGILQNFNIFKVMIKCVRD